MFKSEAFEKLIAKYPYYDHYADATSKNYYLVNRDNSSVIAFYYDATENLIIKTVYEVPLTKEQREHLRQGIAITLQISEQDQKSLYFYNDNGLLITARHRNGKVTAYKYGEYNGEQLLAEKIQYFHKAPVITNRQQLLAYANQPINYTYNVSDPSYTESKSYPAVYADAFTYRSDVINTKLINSDLKLDVPDISDPFVHMDVLAYLNLHQLVTEYPLQEKADKARFAKQIIELIRKNINVDSGSLLLEMLSKACHVYLLPFQNFTIDNIKDLYHGLEFEKDPVMQLLRGYLLSEAAAYHFKKKDFENETIEIMLVDTMHCLQKALASGDRFCREAVKELLGHIADRYCDKFEHVKKFHTKIQYMTGDKINIKALLQSTKFGTSAFKAKEESEPAELDFNLLRNNIMSNSEQDEIFKQIYRSYLKM